MQEGGPDIFRKGCCRSSWAVALWDGSRTSIMSRKERSTDDTWGEQEVLEPRGGKFISVFPQTDDTSWMKLFHPHYRFKTTFLQVIFFALQLSELRRRIRAAKNMNITRFKMVHL